MESGNACEHILFTNLHEEMYMLARKQNPAAQRSCGDWRVPQTLKNRPMGVKRFEDKQKVVIGLEKSRYDY